MQNRSVFIPLALKYRPSRFDDVVGQEGIKQALENSIKLGREPRAVIFSGIRGVGKTTIARLYAKALNCQDTSPQVEKPCGVCKSCQLFNENRHEDIFEIDGASNNGVDEIRSLQETVQYTPRISRFRVFIIDEVHMLSSSAFNALLKTVEEPPPHVIFIFATTELHKIPLTIQSRCQTFHLQPFSDESIRSRLIHLLAKENIPADDDALNIVVKEGRGSMRDALSFLDQVIACGEGKVNLAAVVLLNPALDHDRLQSLLLAALRKDASKTLEALDGLGQSAVDYSRTAEELLTILREAFTTQYRRPLPSRVSAILSWLMSEDRAIRARSVHALFSMINRMQHELWGASVDRFIFENYFLEWCLDEGPSPPPVKAPASPLTTNKPLSPPPAPPLTSTTPEEPVQKSTTPQTPTSWRELLDQFRAKKPLLARILEEVYPMSFSSEEIEIGVKENQFCFEKLTKNPTFLNDLQAGLREHCLFEGVLKVRVLPDDNHQNASVLDVKSQEKDERVARIKDSAINHPITQSVLKELGGQINSVIIKE